MDSKERRSKEKRKRRKGHFFLSPRRVWPRKAMEVFVQSQFLSAGKKESADRWIAIACHIKYWSSLQTQRNPILPVFFTTSPFKFSVLSVAGAKKSRLLLVPPCRVSLGLRTTAREPFIMLAYLVSSLSLPEKKEFVLFPALFPLLFSLSLSPPTELLHDDSRNRSLINQDENEMRASKKNS